ncbi:MAG: hypothetical protein GXO77_07805 [Calditrichaeota bacterium]|nr:hypothetical protein [Calditrichota bacterium]
MKKLRSVCKTNFFVLGIIIASLFFGKPAKAVTVANLQNVKIIGHYFTTGIISSKRMIYTKNPSNSRYLVLLISATLPDAEGKLFNNDFMLGYIHDDDSEDRSRCSAIAISETIDPEKLFDLSEFALGDYSWIKVNGGELRFGLAFYIESDVETINLYRLCAPEPITYRIGRDRLYSVDIFTNVDARYLARAKDAIQKGSYNIVEASESLVSDESGITIHYREQAESQAREISQRLTTVFGKLTTLKKMKLISAVDIVVWLGK